MSRCNFSIVEGGYPARTTEGTPVPQVAFFVANTTRLCIQIPDDIRDRGHVRLRFYGNPRSVTLDDFYRHCKIEIWEGQSIGGPGQEVDKILWTHTRDERFQHLTLEEEVADGIEHPFCADGHPSEYHDYIFSFRGREEVEYLPGQRQEIMLSCGKTLKPNNVEAWYRRQREEKKDQKVDSHFDLLVGGLQGDTDSLTKLGKSHREIDAELQAGLLRYARSRDAEDMRPTLQKYAAHTIHGVRSVAMDMLRHLEETEGRFCYREQQEAALRHLGQFNNKHLAMVMKAIGKRLTGYSDELSVYGRMFRATLMDHWEYNDIRFLWTGIVRAYLPTRSQMMVTILQASADADLEQMKARAGRKPGEISEEDITESFRIMRDHNEVALREQTDPGTGVLPGPMSEKVKMLKGKVLPFGIIKIDEVSEEDYLKILNRAKDEACEGKDGPNPYRLGRRAWVSLMREYAMKHNKCIMTAQQGVKDEGAIIVDWDGERQYSPLSALIDMANIHGLGPTATKEIKYLASDMHHRWDGMTWDETLKVHAFRVFCEAYPDIAASAKKLWESNSPRRGEPGLKEPHAEDEVFEISMMPSVNNDDDWKTWQKLYKDYNAGSSQLPPADGGPEPMYPPESSERLMIMSPGVVSTGDKEVLDNLLPSEGEKCYVLLDCGKHECTYKDSPFHQTLEVKIKGITLSDRQGHLDIVDSRDGVGYRYHGLSRVSGDSFRYERCEELNHPCIPKS